MVRISEANHIYRSRGLPFQGCNIVAEEFSG